MTMNETNNIIRKKETPSKYKYTQNRELSWLKFNQRVLREAADETVPLLEKVKFISIFTSNLDEFYMIRCGSLYDISLVDKKLRDNKTGLTAKEQLNLIYEKTAPLYKEKDEIYSKILAKLREYRIIRHSFDELDSLKRKYITQYFYENVSPLLSPQIIDLRHPFPHMINKKLYIYSILENENTRCMGLIPIPKQLPAYVMFPGTHEYILMEELIYAFAEKIFSNYTVKYSTITAVTRNADVNLQNSPIDEDEDYRHYMKNILKKRNRLAPIRLEFYKYYNHKYNKNLRRKLDLHKNQVFVTNTPINMDYTYDLIDSLPQQIKEELTFPESLETISGHSLDYMYSIQNINMGKNVKSIDSVFRPGNYSGNINIDSQNPYYVVENKILYKKNNGKKDTLVSVLYKIDGTIELDSKVKTIGYYSFYGQSGLKELVIPEGIEKIEASAFTNCPSLLKIEIPKTVKSIGDSCFSDNTSSLEEILIKNKEDSITGAPWGAAKGMEVVQWKK